MKSYKERIHALLALAQHPNTPQAEAESALAMASKLMQKHGLSEKDVDDNSAATSVDVVMRIHHVSGPYRVRRVNILNAIAAPDTDQTHDEYA